MVRGWTRFAAEIRNHFAGCACCAADTQELKMRVRSKDACCPLADMAELVPLTHQFRVHGGVEGHSEASAMRLRHSRYTAHS